MRPSYDSIYLALRINDTYSSNALTPAALQRLVNVYGVSKVEDALRMMWGFRLKSCRRPFAYLQAILQAE